MPFNNFAAGGCVGWTDQSECLALQESARRGEQTIDVVFVNGKLQMVYASEKGTQNEGQKSS